VVAATKIQIHYLEARLREVLLGEYARYNNSLSVKRYQDGLKRLARPYDAFVSEDEVEVERAAREAVMPYLATAGE
jgi:hypothetical protein